MKKIVLILAMMLSSLLVACGDGESASKEMAMFSDYTDIEIFKEIPAMVVENTKIGGADDYGQENYVIHVDGTSLEDYENYVSVLEKAGFKKYCDNGKEGMEGFVYSTTFTKDNLVVGVTQAVRLERTIISASADLPLSEHLIYKDEYVEDNVEGAKTTMHFPELEIYNGLSIIIQLKNGHFVVQDGGQGEDAANLLNYLESLVSEGEKPVIEGWFFSHSHADHVQAIRKIATDIKDSKRIYVEGFYFFYPSEKMIEMTQESGSAEKTAQILKTFQTQDGEQTPVYRPQLGQRYYFNDIVMDVAVTLEASTYDQFECIEYNDTSVYFMHYIDGQKMLTSGDGVHTTTRLAMSLYDESYFDLDIYQVSHHGINVYDYFTDYCNIQTAIYPSFRLGSCITDPSDVYTRVDENAYFLQSVKEAYSRENGSLKLTFPYELGTAEVVAKDGEADE